MTILFYSDGLLIITLLTIGMYMWSVFKIKCPNDPYSTIYDMEYDFDDWYYWTPRTPYPSG